jgi:anti-sigma factor RsiW
MNDRSDSLSPELLSDYVDGELDEPTRRGVEARVRENPVDRERLRDYQAQSETLHRAYASVLDEPVPDRLMEVLERSDAGEEEDAADRHAPTRPVPWQWPRWGGMLSGAMAAGLALAVGGVAGWVVRGYMIEQEAQMVAREMFLQEAIKSYSLYATDDSSWQHAGLQSDREKFGEWFQSDQELEIPVPDLSDDGYSFVGGRPLPDSNGLAGQMLYRNEEGNTIVLYFQYMEGSGRGDRLMTSRPTEGGGSIFEYNDELSAYYWTSDSGKASYAVLGSMGQDALASLGQRVLDQLAPW